MKFDSLTPVLDRGAQPYLEEGTRTAPSAFDAPRPREQGLHALVANLRQQCRARRMLLMWHFPGSEPQVLASDRREVTSGAAGGPLREHAVAICSRISRASSVDARFQIHWQGGSFTAALSFDRGVITLSGALAAEDTMAREACRQTLCTFEPFLTVFFDQWLSGQRALARMRSLDEAVDCSGTPTILLGNNGEVVQANRAAEMLFARSDGLRRQDGRLACASLAETLRLQTVIDHLRRGDGMLKEPNPVLAVTRTEGRPLTIALAAALASDTVVADEVRVIAYVFDPEQDMTSIIEPVCRLHTLSRSETKLTCALVAGDSLGVAAQRIGVTEQTARSYLKQVFSKTETNRQAELVQLMLKSSVRLCFEGRTQTFAQC